MEFKFLGTGSSVGIPVLGCGCLVCCSRDPKDKRRRTSACVRIDGKTFLVDAGPDTRQQLLEEKITHVDALFLTHMHFDHIGGLDELRPLCFGGKPKIPCYLSAASMETMRLSRHYFFSEDPSKLYFDFRVFEKKNGTVVCQEIPVRLFTYFQVGMEVTGFGFGKLAYINDIREYDDSLFHELAGMDVLVLDCIGIDPNPGHLCLQEAIDFAKRTQIPRTYLTHMGHRVSHEKIAQTLPSGIELAYDGCTVTI